MDNSRQPDKKLEDAFIQRSRWGTVALSGLLVAVNIYFLITAFNQPRSFLISLTQVLLATTLALAIVGSILALLHRQEYGLKTTLFALFLLGLTVSAMFQGRTFSASVSILIVSILAVEWLMPVQSKRAYFIFTASTFIMMWVLEWINPPWRIIAGTVFVGPITAIVFAAFLGFMAYRRSRHLIATSLRLQITVWTGTIITVLAIILLTYSIVTTRQNSIEAAQKEALAISEANAKYIHDQLNIPLVTARALADSLEGIKDPENPLRLGRTQVNAMLKQVAEDNPTFLATYTLWEPDAFDGFDSIYIGKPGHDETGRFIPYWVRRPDGSVTVEPLAGYETPGIGDWYLIPRQTRQEYTVAPLIYPVAGVDTMMASFIVPIIMDGKFYGITGVDAPITFLQTVVDEINLYDNQAEAVLLTDTGTLIAVHNSPELSNQPAEQIFSDFAELQPRITAGEAFISLSPDGQYLRVFSPVDIGEVGTHWSFSLIIPFAAITAEATSLAIQETALGLILVAISLYILWFLMGQIVRPIRDLTTVAETITQGNLNATADVQSVNETGILARALNNMTNQLRETFASLEQRIAERTRNLELAAEVGRTVSHVRSLDVMLTEAAELIRKQFDLYYVQVYLTNPSQTYLILQAGTGEVGKALLERDHRLPLNVNSLNGRAAIEKNSVVIADTLKSITFKPNSLLPETHSEMAVPLMVGDTVVGVLDMQSKYVDALNKDVLPAFEALAGQIAIAIQNSNFLAETQQARAEVEAQARRLVRRNWEEYMDGINEPEQKGFIFENERVSPLKEREDIVAAGENAVVAPIAVTGEALGSLIVELEEQTSQTRSNELIDAVARQVSQQIESLRLLESAERYRAEAEQAARRLTREGWQDYLSTRQDKALGFMYDLKEVKPVGAESKLLDVAVSLPIKVGEEQVGQLAVQGIHADDKATLDLANAVVDRLGKHIEGLRLLEKTEESRAVIQLSQERLSEALEIARLGNWEYDVEKDIFTFNDNFYLVFHTNVKEVGSYYMSSAEYAQRFVHPEDAPVVGGEIGKALTSTDRYYTASLEHRVIFGDGKVGYISVNVHVERDEQGKIVRFYGANQNITERKLTEEELRARDLQLSAALQQTEQRRLEAEALVRELDVQKYALDQHSIVAITDVAGKITYANDKFVEISKYTREELLGQDHRLLNSGYHSKEFIRNLWVTIANGNVFHGELRNRAKDGSLYWVDTTIVPLLNASGKPERYLAIRTDITQRKRDEEVIAKRASELQAVAEIATHASQADNIADLLQTVVDMTKSSYNLYHAHIYILNEEKTKLALAAGAGEVGRKMVAQKRTIDLDHPHSLVARAARTGSGAISNDVTQEPDFLPNPLLPDTKAEMAIPIKSGDMVIGILDVQADYVNRFTEEDIAIKTTLAQQVAASLENIQQYQIAQKVARELEVVANVSTATATISDVDLLLQEVVDKTKAAFNLYHAHVYLLNEAGDTLELAAGAGEVGRKMVSEGRQIPLDSEKSLVARAARNGKGQVVNDVTADPDFLPHPLLPDTKSEQAVPMIVAGNVIGVLDVQSELFNRFTEIDVNINTTLAAQTAVALQNARTYSQAQRQAQRESALNVISQKIQSATTVEAVLQIAARELGHALGAPMTIAQLSMKDSKS